MDDIQINVFNTVGNSFCVEAEDGQKVYSLIHRSLKEGKSVRITFQNVEMLTSAFLNTAIGQVYRDFSEEEVRTKIAIEDMAPEDRILLKRVVDTAKLYYRDPARMEKTINEILGES